jgi:hypothetical protein
MMMESDWAKEEARKIVAERAFDSDTGQRNKERIIAALRAAELRGRVAGMNTAADMIEACGQCDCVDHVDEIRLAAKILESPPTT